MGPFCGKEQSIINAVISKENPSAKVAAHFGAVYVQKVFLRSYRAVTGVMGFIFSVRTVAGLLVLPLALNLHQYSSMLLGGATYGKPIVEQILE